MPNDRRLSDPSDLGALARAVTDARPDRLERDPLEWKRPLHPGEKKVCFVLAKNILVSRNLATPYAHRLV